MPKTSSPAEIREALKDLLANDSYRSAADRLGVMIRERDGAAVAADCLEEVVPAVAGRPVC